MMKIQTQSCVVKGKYDVAVVQQEVEYQGTGTLVKITRGGICGSDLHYYQEGKVGSFQVRQPMVLGHEVIGEVVASDTARLAVGQKVALNPSKPCGQCKYCLANQQNQCLHMRFFGSAMYFPHVDGAFTQYKVVDSAQCIAFDADRDEKVMVFAEPLAVAIHAAKQPGEVNGKRVFVSGVGPIGCLLVAALKALGASEIVCADLSPRIVGLGRVSQSRLNLAQRLFGMGLNVDIGLIGAIAGVLQHFFQRVAQHSQIVVERGLIRIRISRHVKFSVFKK